jgi:hypothetical protein
VPRRSRHPLINSYPYFEVSTEVLGYWTVKTLGHLQSISRGLDPVVICKIHTIPILEYQMRISTNYIFSDAQAKKFANPKYYDIK